jgi:heat shock protein HslJ
MTRTTPTVLTLALAATLAGCGYSQDAPVTPQLGGTQWTVIEMYDSRVLLPPDGEAPSIDFSAEDRSASGSTGCNRFTVSYTLSVDRINFGPVAATRMACQEPLGRNEQRFLRALDEASRVRTVGSTLELLSGETVIARMRARAGAP